MRPLGYHDAWDDAGWDGGDDGGSTWAPATTFSDLSALLVEYPDPADGVSVGPRASGDLRFIVQILNPTASSDGGTSAWGVAGWDTTDTWESSAGAWVDITAIVRGIEWSAGQSDPLGRAEVGEGTVTLANRDGAVSPWATSGAFTFGGESWLRTGVLIRWGVLCDPATLDADLPVLDDFEAFFTGRIELVDEGTSDNVDGWVTLTVIETLADLANTPDDYPLLPQYATSAIYALAIAGGWTFQRDVIEVPNDDVAVTATTLSGLSTIERMQLIADCMHWDVITDGRGRLKVIPRKQADSDSGLTFSNAPSGNDLPVVTVNPFSSSDRVLTEATASSPTGSPQTASSGSAVSRFGVISNRYGFPRNDLPLADADVLALVQKVVRLRALDDLGIASIELTGDQDLARMPAALAFLASQARGAISFDVRWRHPSGNELTLSVIAEGQSHHVTMEGNQLLWTATIQTARAG